MIADRLSRITYYEHLIKGASRIEEFVKGEHWLTMNPGEWLVLDNALRVILLDGSNYTAGIMETHEKNFDVHVTIGGVDRMNVASIDDLAVHQPYDGSNDYALWKANPSINLTIAPGNFLFVAPSDAHNNSLEPGSKKLVFKIPV